VALFIFWIPAFADVVRAIAAQFGSGAARQIANAHTLFNVSLGLIFLPFTAIFAGFILRIFPDKKELKGVIPATWHLDDSMISTPEFAIDLARTEITRMAKILGRMLRAIIIPFMSDKELIKKQGLAKEETSLLLEEIPTRDEIFPELSLLEGIDMREEKIDFLEERVGDYLIQIA
jgi:phosphate:Na+ symporter